MLDEGCQKTSNIKHHISNIIHHTSSKKMKHIFKNLIRLAVFSLLISMVYSCEKQDFIDEQVITGDIGPQVYWEIGSAAVSAGTKMPFKLQYYSTVAEIERSEVWYNLEETESKSVSCPWLSTFTFAINSTQSEEKRISQFIQSYPHSQAVWNDTLRAYKLEGEFPVSGTLSPFVWFKPEKFEAAKMDEYFGTGFMKHFKDSLYSKMQFADFQKMYLGMGLLDNFRQFTDSTFNTNSNSWEYHFPKKSDGTKPVPDEIKNIYSNIEFARLIENSSSGVHEVEYRRTYKINAIMRVYDKRGIYGITTPSKLIDIN